MGGRIIFDNFWFNALTIEQLNDIIIDSIHDEQKLIIAHHNLHSLYLMHKVERLRDFYDSVSFIHADGMPLVWLGRLCGHQLSSANRITYMDWIHPLLNICNRYSLRIFYLGSRDNVAKRAINILESTYNNINFKCHSGFFELEGSENDMIVDKINLLKPHIVFIGMGMPRQEFWIQNNINRIDTNIFLPCGACFEYIANEVRTPPRWSGRIGMEWLFRLIENPRKFYLRYLIEPWFLFCYLWRSKRRK